MKQVKNYEGITTQDLLNEEDSSSDSDYMNKDIQLDKYSTKPSLISKIITKPFKPENTI